MIKVTLEKLFCCNMIASSLVACAGGRPQHTRAIPTVDPSLAHLPALMLDQSDVPTNWYDDGSYWNVYAPLADALVHGFQTTSGNVVIFLQQELRIYEDPPTAHKYFIKEKQELDTGLAQDGYIPSEFPFQSQADEFYFICNDNIESRGVQLIHCTALQVYGKVISEINTNMDGVYITVDQVASVLERVDEKLVSSKAIETTP